MKKITNKNDYELLKKMYEKDIKWITKDKNRVVFCYRNKPYKYFSAWDCDNSIFESISLQDDSFLNWEDEQPTLIEELLKEYENKHESENNCNNIKPNHYNIHEFECFDEMQMIYGTKALITFCKLNVHKYRYRFLKENKEEDLQKANEYLKKIKELQETSFKNKI